MNTTTLRGVFSEPKPVHRRNFVRENIKHLKEMQAVGHETEVQEQKLDRFKHVAAKVHSNLTARGQLSKDNLTRRPASHNQGRKQNPFYQKQKYDVEQKIIHRGVQTERPEDIQKLYESGVLKYPTLKTKQSPHRTRDHGDTTVQMLKKNVEKLGDKPSGKQKKVKIQLKKDELADPNLPPQGYQKGIVPKYIQTRKEEMAKPLSMEEAVSGMVLLPDEERKEYLRVARENYAALIKELNGMPVSNDTLKKRKRKMEIEEELKRLDEVIKIFQKPKVFVKADA